MMTNIDSRGPVAGTVFLVFVLLVFVPSGSAVSVYSEDPGSGITLGMGERLQSHITVYNPRGEQDAVSVTMTPAMNQGTLVANLIADGRWASSLDVDVGAQRNRSIQTTYLAASCATSTCTGDVTITARSYETGDISTITIPVTIQRRQEVYGSPGITGTEFLVIGVLGAFSILFLQKGRRSRRNSDSPER